jgi:hypothetical protein
MRQARAPHRVRIVLADPGLIAIGKRHCDSAARARQAGPDMRAQPIAQGVEPASPARLDHLDRPDRAPGAAALLEPCIACEIMPARKSHGRRRLDPCLDLDPRARAEASGGARGRHGQSQSRHVPARRHGHPNVALSDKVLDPLDPGVEDGNRRAFEPRRRDPGASSPDQAAARGERHPAKHQRAP